MNIVIGFFMVLISIVIYNITLHPSILVVMFVGVFLFVSFYSNDFFLTM